MKLTSRHKAIGISIVAHAILLAVLLAWMVPKTTSKSSTAARPAPPSGPPQEHAAPAKEPLPSPTISPPPMEKISEREIQQSVDRQLEAVERLPDERKLTELEKNAKRLQSIASPESVERTATTVAKSLGVDTQQYATIDKTVEGSLDVASAQIEDVIRIQDSDGTWNYTAKMVDRHGHRSQVPMSQQDGEKLYDTFQIMAKYPMMRGVYQSVVMPMLQKLTSDSAEATKPSQPTAAEVDAAEPTDEP